MCSILITNKKIEDLDSVNKYLKLRGPDYTNQLSLNGINFIHNLLHMTGDFKTQPFIDGDTVCLFNGEIYNYKSFGDFSTDGECLIPLYKQFGTNFVKQLDGEFCLVLVDFSKDILLFSTDVFSTKPIWYSIEDDHFGIASYESALQKLNFKHIKKLKANTTQMRKLSELSSSVCYQSVFDFSLSQHKNSYDAWTSAFKKSIKKRYVNSNQKVFIGLSSGYDSGAICCELLEQKVDFHAYSVLGRENSNILSQRHNLIKSPAQGFIFRASQADYAKAQLHLSENVEEFNYKIYSQSSEYNEFGLSVKRDGGSNGLSFVCQKAKENDRKIYLSGQGADEICSDYGFNGVKKYPHSNFGGLFPENLSSIFPWASFYESSQLSYLMKEEYISGSFGLEGRYPFLDKDLVQEFLWLSSDLKNKNYKAPIYNYLTEHNFPFSKDEKIGFNLL